MPRGTVFQPFLEQSLQRPVRGRGYAVSLALHALAALLIWLAWGRMESGDPPDPARLQAAVSLRLPIPHRAPAPIGPAAAALVAEPPGKAASRRLRARPTPVVIAPAPELPAAAEEIAPDEPDGDLVGQEAGAGAGGAQAGAGAAAGPQGEGNLGTRPARRRPLQLFGRVVGGNRRAGMGPQGMPYAPLKESTELRTYDVFPPLPAAQWTSDRPYLVVLDVCVAGDGQVSEVALVRPASRLFDPVVLEAVRTWRYRPRLVDGEARAFCHVVAIKYEQL